MNSPRWLGRTTAGWRMIAVAVVALVLTAIVFFQWGSASSTPEAKPTAKPTPTATQQPTTADIYRAVAPSVVSIQSPDGAGTGIVVNADGTILTANHVVRGAPSLRVTFADGTTSTATITGANPEMDIATIKPETLPSVLVPAVLGASDRLSVGDAVVAIGDQLGLTRTTTSGVVSGLDRAARGKDGTRLAGLIQFDAAVNPGSSGGPLVNAHGETVGIVVALLNPTDSDTFVGVGFAVPIGAALSGGGDNGDRGPLQ